MKQISEVLIPCLQITVGMSGTTMALNGIVVILHKQRLRFLMYIQETNMSWETTFVLMIFPLSPMRYTV